MDIIRLKTLAGAEVREETNHPLQKAIDCLRDASSDIQLNGANAGFDTFIVDELQSKIESLIDDLEYQFDN